jgi:hypothetical protein
MEMDGVWVWVMMMMGEEEEKRAINRTSHKSRARKLGK